MSFVRLAAYRAQHPAQFSPPGEEDQDLFDAAPPELAPLFAASYGAEVDFTNGDYLMAIDDVLDLVEQEELFDELPGCVPFAVCGPDWVLLDTQGVLGARGAVVLCSGDDLRPPSCRPGAPDLEGFVARMLEAR